jgi:hypothetical protein
VDEERVRSERFDPEHALLANRCGVEQQLKLPIG